MIFPVRKFRFSTYQSTATLPIIVEAARYGDENAYRELVNRTYKSVKSYCSVMGSPMDSEDLAQEAYVRAIRGNTPILSTENLEAFMIAIAKFVCADFIKLKAKVKSLQVKLEAFDTEFDADIKMYSDFDFDIQVLDELSGQHKQIVFLVVIAGFSYDETAQILELPIGTVRSRLNRAKEILRNSLDNGTISEQLMTS